MVAAHIYARRKHLINILLSGQNELRIVLLTKKSFKFTLNLCTAEELKY